MDLRLAWLAVGLWFSTAIAIAIETFFNPLWGVVWLVVVVYAAQVVKNHFRSSRVDAKTIFKFSLLGVIVGTLLATIRVLPLVTGPIHDASLNSQIVHGAGVVASDPVITTKRNALDWSSGQLIRVALTVTEVEVHGKSTRLRIPVMAFSSQNEVLNLGADLIPGQHLEFVGKLTPALPGKAFAANLSLTEAPLLLGSPPRYQGLASGLRAGLHQAMQGTSEAAQGLVPGLALGDSSALKPDLALAMKTSGLSHLIAVSGTNVTLLIVVALSLLRRASIHRNYRYLLALLALITFVVVVRPQPSVLRATAMGLVALFAGYSGSKKSPLPALCLAVIALVVIDPWLAMSYGFALSVAATFGLLVWSKKLFAYLDQRLSRRIPSWVIETLTITLCAQLAVLPLMIALGSRISLATIPANMVAVPVAGPTMLLGLVIALVAPISMPVAQFLSGAVAVPADLIAATAVRAANITWLTIPWPHGLGGVCLAVVVLLNLVRLAAIWQKLSEAKRNSVVSIAIVLCSLLWVAPTISCSNWPGSNWVMVACDIGQGDAAVINVGHHSGVVIDVGGDPELIDECLKRLEVKSIPLLLLTHFHADHVGGLEGALRNRKVGEIRVSPLANPPETTKFVNATLARLHMNSKVMTYPEHFKVSDVEFQCVWPSRLILGEGSDPNNASVAMLVKAKGKTIFMTGDIEPAVQNAIMRELGDVQVDAIKIAHHGSKNQSAPFAAWVDAPIALISVGAKNDYGHPSPETIALYEMTGSQVFRTDTQGDLALVVTDHQLRVATYK